MNNQGTMSCSGCFSNSDSIGCNDTDQATIYFCGENVVLMSEAEYNNLIENLYSAFSRVSLNSQRVYQPWNRVKAFAEIRALDDDSLTAKGDR